MKVSLSWLATYVDLSMDAGQLAEKLTMAGLEVEAVEDRYAFLDTVLVGRVAAVTPHPQADKLKLCRVEAGEQTYAVVCGAPNVQPGMLAPLALPGTQLINGTILALSTIRGQRSEGMLCSETELGLGADASGLMVLDGTLKPGTPLNQALNLSDPVLDISLTPNRSDCLSIIGMAREVAGLQGTPIRRPAIELPEMYDDITAHTSVTVEAQAHCPRYAARLITDLSVGPSPFWLQDRLRSVGLRPINNLVDVTNFVMLETGQPLHAFDFDHLEEHRIVVRTAQAGETFTTLDGRERELTPEMLLICDGCKPVAIGGVMGGLNSEIEESTRRVLLESAWFNPVSIRKTARRLGLNTDAAHRFERGVDPQGTLFAVDRAAALMVELGAGRLVGGTIDACHQPPEPKAIQLSATATNRHLGTSLNAAQIAELLGAIEFEVIPSGDDTLLVSVPSFRVDVDRPEDLMEEVARRWGYENIPTTFSAITALSQTADKLWIQRQLMRQKMAAMGFNEVITYSFIHKDSCDRLGLAGNDARRQTIEILNPLSEDQAILRTSLIPGLLETMQRNTTRQIKTLKLFETGKIFIGQGPDSLPQETEMLAGLWTGDRHASGWFGKPVACDFFDLKGAVERLFSGLHLPDALFTRLEPPECTYTRRGASARILVNGKPAGILGEVDAKVLDAYNLKQPAFIFELDLHLLAGQMPEGIAAQQLPRYPATTRDATLIVDLDIEAQALISRIKAMDQPLVEDALIFDVFQGPPVPQHRKSISLRVIYRSDQQTLEDETVNRIHKDIADQLVAQFKADLPA
jgi:phenylalanyl-tRNA synthetase beta chain